MREAVRTGRNSVAHHRAVAQDRVETFHSPVCGAPSWYIWTFHLSLRISADPGHEGVDSAALVEDLAMLNLLAAYLKRVFVFPGALCSLSTRLCGRFPGFRG